MKKNSLLEKIITFSLPVIFILVFGLVLLMQTRTEKLRSTAAVAETESESETAVERKGPELIVERSGQEQDSDAGQVEDLLSAMTLADKVAQMFIITPDALTGVDGVVAAGEATKNAYGTYPVGGLIYFDANIQTEYQVTEMLKGMKDISTERVGVPAFLSVDEEGGVVARIGNSDSLSVDRVQPMLEIGQTSDTTQAYTAGETIGGYLRTLGFNLDYAPVADVLDSEANTVIGNRSFGTDPEQVGEMVAAAIAGFESRKILTTLKHFPGHGATTADSHLGYASNSKTKAELEASDFIPFKAGIDAGVDMVMVGHISLPNVTGEDTPATLSEEIINDLLRGELGYDGIVITDAMNMGAITQYYDSGSAAVKAIKAGVDILLMPEDFVAAYQAVLAAVENGEIDEQRIDQSVARILKVKTKL